MCIHALCRLSFPPPPPPPPPPPLLPPDKNHQPLQLKPRYPSLLSSFPPLGPHKNGCTPLTAIPPAAPLTAASIACPTSSPHSLHPTDTASPTTHQPLNPSLTPAPSPSQKRVYPSYRHPSRCSSQRCQHRCSHLLPPLSPRYRYCLSYHHTNH